jgi:hypothetical protein
MSTNVRAVLYVLGGLVLNACMIGPVLYYFYLNQDVIDEAAIKREVDQTADINIDDLNASFEEFDDDTTAVLNDSLELIDSTTVN